MRGGFAVQRERAFLTTLAAHFSFSSVVWTTKGKLLFYCAVVECVVYGSNLLGEGVLYLLLLLLCVCVTVSIVVGGGEKSCHDRFGWRALNKSNLCGAESIIIARNLARLKVTV